MTIGETDTAGKKSGLEMFRVAGAGGSCPGLTAAQADSEARSLRKNGATDVQIFREDGSRISMYALEQIVRLQPEPY